MNKKYSSYSFVLSPENVRRLGPNNAEEVEKLTLKTTKFLFSKREVGRHLETNYLSLGIYNETNELCGVLSFNCFPNIPALPPWDWEYWLSKKYELLDVLPMSTLWIHYAVWDRRYTTLFLKPMLQNLYQSCEFLEHVIMVCPPGINKVEFIEGIASRVLPIGHNTPHKSQTLFITKKTDFIAQYVIRRAVEEDNDDLVAIIPKQLEDTYGHYYISEILSNEQSDRQIIVAEHHGSAVGVLCLNENVNYDLLNEEFELVPYYGLKKQDSADDVFKAKGSTTLMPIMQEVSSEHLSTFTLNEIARESDNVLRDESDSEEDEFSLVNLSSTLLFHFLCEEETASLDLSLTESTASIESHFSAVMLNEEYLDHLSAMEKADVEEKRSVKRKESRMESIPAFYGNPNACAMEICSALPEHENCLFLLFQAAFECFPHRDYIVVSFPTDAKVCYVVKHFARVVPRASSVFTQELYVLHRSAILGTIWARPADQKDKPYIPNLVASCLKPSSIEDSFKEAVDVKGSALKAYSFFCERQLVGFAVVSEEDEHEYLQLHYNLDDWMDFQRTRFGAFGTIEQFVLSPIFQHHLAFLLQELHRLSNFSALFYRLKHYDFAYNHRSFPIVNAITNMIPVLPNKLPQYSSQVTDEYLLPQVLQKNYQPFGLYLSTPRLCSMRKIEINNKIVVIGAGATAASFLEALLLGTNSKYLITFTNVTVLSPHGITYHKHPSIIRDMVFVSDGHLDRRYLDSINLKTYVHVVQGVMTGINRREKYVSLNDDSFLPYDYLFLMCGEQFQKPSQMKKEVVKKKPDFPQNVFIINTEADAANAFNALKNLTSGQKQGTMVVFGHYLEAYCCLAALLKFGVSGSNLVYIDPNAEDIPQVDRHDHLTQVFNNSAIETAVLDEILFQGVTIYQDYNFVEWHLNSTKNFITSAKFESKYKFVEIELSALFIYHARGVSTRTFQAIAKSGLVFNGRLVIDKNCQTNDPCIYGAGPLTMYSKRYHAEHLMHRYFNSQEVGKSLGLTIRKKLVPEEYWDEKEQTVVNMNRPVVQYCRFPGNLNYLHVAKPGHPVPLDVAMTKCNYGRVLITGDCKKLKERGYFRLHLNQFQTVETITCLAKFNLDVRNYVSLWGKHEILLNHLLMRYDTSMIPDLFAYFDQPWATAIYHKDFPKIMADINSVVASTVSEEGVKLIDEVRNRLEKNDWNPLNKMQTDELEEICRDAKLIKLIGAKVVDFLHDNYMYLPMYVHQLLIRWIQHQTLSSPLFARNVFDSGSKPVGDDHPFFHGIAVRYARSLTSLKDYEELYK